MFVRSIVSPVRAQRLTPLSLLGVRFKSAPATATKTAPAPTKQEESKGAFGDFVRPRVEHGHLVSGKEVPIARPQNPPELLEHGMDQASNYPYTWSEDQRPKSEAMKGPRFEQMAMDFQPNAPSAMELISTHPIQFTTKRVAACDGGDGPLGHPRVYINLDKPGPKGCPYCGIRYQKEEHHFHYVP